MLVELLALLCAELQLRSDEFVGSDAREIGPPALGELDDLLDDGRYAAAEALARAECERLAGHDTLEVALLETRLGEAMRRNGKQDQAATLAYAEHAYRRARELVGDGDARTGECLFQLGTLLYTRAELDQARSALERALALFETALGPDSPDVAMTLVFLGSLAWDDGRDEAHAFELFQRASEIQALVLGDAHPDVAWRLEREAIVHQGCARFERARPLLERALAIRERALRPAHPLVGVTLYNLGALALQQRDWIAARSYNERALEVRRSTLGRDHPNVVWSLCVLGDLELGLGDFEGAQGRLEEALEIQRRVGARDLQTAIGQLDLAAVLVERATPDALERGCALVDDSIAILLALGESQALRLVHARVQRAGLAEEQQDLQRAQLELTRARESVDRLALRDGATFPTLLMSEARLLAREGDLPGARSLLEQARDVQTEFIGTEHADLVDVLYWHACALLRSGERAAGAREALRADDLIRAEWRRTASGLEEETLLALDERYSNSLGLAVYAAATADDPALAGEVWDALLASRTRGFEELAARRRLARTTRDAEILARVRALAGTQKTLSDLFVHARTAGIETRDDELDGEQGGALERARQERRSAEHAFVLAARAERTLDEGPGLAEIVRALPEHSALVAYAFVLGEGEDATAASTRLDTLQQSWQGVAFVLPAGATSARIVPLGKAEPIEELVARARASVDEQEYRRFGLALRAAVWDPLVPLLREAQRVFIVPAGPLHTLDFAALPVGERDYVVENGPTLHYLSSERELLDERDPRPLGSGLLAIGGADFGETEGNALPHFAELRESRAEVSRIAERFEAALPGEPATVLRGSEAREGAFTALAPGHRVLHVATHGFALDSCASSPTLARGITVPANAGRRLARTSAPRDALLSFGLALAGANGRAQSERSEDGFLTAEEISGMDLSGVEWVVVSACESGLGVLRSRGSKEGLLGLRRAFRLAGAQTVIASLWPVEDRSAREWMEELYRARLETGCDTASAVRRADLEILARRRREGASTHPRTWAGFTASGGWK